MAGIGLLCREKPSGAVAPQTIVVGYYGTQKTIPYVVG